MFHALLVCALLAAAPPPPAPPDPRAALADARKALGKRRPDLARVRSLLGGQASWTDATQRADALQVLADADVADHHPDAAALKLREAAAVADDAGLPARYRTRVLRRLDVLARSAHRPAVDTARQELLDADAALAASARWPLFPEAPLVPARDVVEAATRTYARDGSRVRLARSRMALALADAVEGRRAALEHAGRAWSAIPDGDTDAIRRLRVESLRTSARARILLARKDHRAAEPLARAVADLAEADVQEAVPEKRVAPYVRSVVAVQVCAALEALEGRGACRRMEQTLGLAPAFRDFTRDPAQAVLSDDAVNRTQAEYGFLLDRCALEQARADPTVGGVQFELTWVVQPTGLTDEFQLDPRRFREHPVAACFRAALATFRYPPYRSAERRVVTVPLRVNAP